MDATTQIKAIDGTQGIVIDKYGIKLQKIDPSTGEIDPHQTWMTNNMILMSDDGFKTSRSALGQVTVDGQTYYGIIAEMVLSGYIEGSQIKGGTIQIGDLGEGKWAFEVDEDGNVSMLGGQVQFNADKNSLAETESNLQNQIDQTFKKIEEIDNKKMYRIEIVASGPTIFNSQLDSATLTCNVYSWDTNITNTLVDDMFYWKRVSNNAELDIIWNAQNEHQGRGLSSIIITTDDVLDDASTSFMCEVELPD